MKISPVQFIAILYCAGLQGVAQAAPVSLALNPVGGAQFI